MGSSFPSPFLETGVRRRASSLLEAPPAACFSAPGPSRLAVAQPLCRAADHVKKAGPGEAGLVSRAALYRYPERLLSGHLQRGYRGGAALLRRRTGSPCGERVGSQNLFAGPAGPYRARLLSDRSQEPGVGI